MIKIIVRFENSAIAGYTPFTMVELLNKMEEGKDRYLHLWDKDGRIAITIIDLQKVAYIEKGEY